MKTETITCECGATFEWEAWAIPGLPSFDPYLLRPEHCPKCSERIEEEQKELERLGRIAKIARNALESAHAEMPAIFRNTDTSHQKFNLRGWNHVKDWHPRAEKPWLGLIGETGTCKSRIAYMLAAWEVERMAFEMGRVPSFQFVAAYEISEMASRLVAQSFEAKDEARADLARLRDARLLLIDDLGKGRMTAAVSAELFALIDHRYRHALPTIWTANSTPEQIAASMSEDMAAPFAGRINDSSRIIRMG